MNYRWYCIIVGQEIGPLSDDGVLDLVHEGQLSLDDLIRSEDSQEWVSVRSIQEPASVASGGVVAETGADSFCSLELTDLDDYDDAAENSLDPEQGLQDILEAAETIADVPSADHENHWYWQTLGTVFGPISFSDLFERTQQGEITPEELIKCQQDGHWVPAGSIVGLTFATRESVAQELEVQEFVEQESFTPTFGPPVVVEERAATTWNSRQNSFATPPEDRVAYNTWQPAADAPSDFETSFAELDDAPDEEVPDEQVPVHQVPTVDARVGDASPAGYSEQTTAQNRVADYPTDAYSRPRGFVQPEQSQLAPADEQSNEAADATALADSTGSATLERIWFCQIQGNIVGPITLPQLRQLFAEGALSEDDLIRVGAEGQWLPASAMGDVVVGGVTEVVGVPVLAAGPPVVMQSVVMQQPAPLTLSSLGDETELLNQLLALLQEKSGGSLGGGARAGGGADPTAEPQWYCILSGHEVGPLTIEGLAQMVLQRRIFREDLLRLGTTGVWFPAGSVEELFPSENDGSAKKPGIASGAAETAGIFERLEMLYAKEAELKAGAETDGLPAAAPAAAPPRTNIGEILKGMDGNVLREGAARKKWEEENKETFIEQLRNNPKQLAALGAICVVGLLYWLIPILMSGVWQRSAYYEVTRLAKEVQDAHKGTGAPFDKREVDVKKRLDAISKAQKKYSGGGKAVARATGSLKDMIATLKAPPSTKADAPDPYVEAETAYESNMKQARTKLGIKK